METRLRSLGTRQRIAVVCCYDSSTSQAVERALSKGFAEVILIGERSKLGLSDAAERYSEHITHIEAATPDEAARTAVSLVRNGQADILIAFEPGEAARVLPLLKKDGVLVTASRVVQPVTASLSKTLYEAAPVIEALQAREGKTVVVDEAPLLEEVGNPKALNIILLTVAMGCGVLGLTQDEFRQAVSECLKPRCVEMNLKAIDIVNERLGLV